MLLASPGLTSLGLSLAPEQGMGNYQLQRLINYFHSKGENGQVLELSQLHLGLGFLPVPPDDLFTDDYLNQLTDLQTLTDLRLDNSSSITEPFDLPNFHIFSPVFAKATNLRMLSVERISSDVVGIIHLISGSEKDLQALDSLEVTGYFESLDEGEGEEEYYDDFRGPPMFSVPLEQTGYHWRKVSCGTKLESAPYSEAERLLREFVSQCSEIEELSMPMDREHLDLFKSDILPRTKRLYALKIPNGDIAKFKAPGFIELNREQAIKRIKLDESKEKIKEEHESQTANIAKELFECNRRMMQEDAEITALRSITVGPHTYCCLLANPCISGIQLNFTVKKSPLNGAEEVEEFGIMKVPPDQSYGFDPITLKSAKFGS